MSIAPTSVREAWRPTLQRVATSGGGSRMAAVSPSLSGAVAAIAMAAVSTLVVILMPTAGATLEVTLMVPPPPVAAEEERETELLASPGGGPPGSSLPPGPKAPEEGVAGTESGRPMAVHANEVVDILSDDEVDIAAGESSSLVLVN